MNEDKIQTIKKIIDTAEALTATEKNEWLQLIPIMNDKQLNELVRILELGKPKQNVKSVLGQPISHIANLPHAGSGGLVQPKVIEPVLTKPKPLDELPKPIAPKPEVIQNKPAVPAPSVAPSTPVTAPVIAPPKAPESPKMPEPAIPIIPKQEPVQGVLKNVPRPIQMDSPRTVVPQQNGVINTEKLEKNTPFVVPSFTSGPMQTPEVVQKKATLVTPDASSAPVTPHLESLNDLAVFTPSQFRLMDPKVFTEILTNFVKQNEYFQVKFALEQSPLYKTYIAMGKAMLESNLDFMAVQNEYKTSNKEYLTQLEFERIADLFASIQVN